MEEEPIEDPIMQYRNMLQTGISIKYWIRGTATTQLMFVTGEWNAIMLKDASRKVKKGERFLLRQIDRVVKGMGQAHKKRTPFASGSKVCC